MSINRVANNRLWICCPGHSSNKSILYVTDAINTSEPVVSRTGEPYQTLFSVGTYTASDNACAKKAVWLDTSDSRRPPSDISWHCGTKWTNTWLTLTFPQYESPQHSHHGTSDLASDSSFMVTLNHKPVAWGCPQEHQGGSLLASKSSSWLRVVRADR